MMIVGVPRDESEGKYKNTIYKNNKSGPGGGNKENNNLNDPKNSQIKFYKLIPTNVKPQIPIMPHYF